MSFWSKNITSDAADARADVIIQKKGRKQNRQAKGLGAVSIGRQGPRTIHQRNEDRHVLQGTQATACIDGTDHEVKLMNLSSNGVMIGFEGNLAIGQTITLAIEGCAPITTEVRWIRRSRVGLEFVAETVIIAEAGVQDFIVRTIAREHENAGYSPNYNVGPENRAADKRHPLVWVGKLRAGRQQSTARLRNISASGAMVELADALEITKGDHVDLALDTAGSVRSAVRWVAGQQLGLEFVEDFDVGKLVDEACAELGPAEGDDAHADADGSLRIRLGKVETPHHPPEMEYGRLTLDEVYATLHPGGRPEGHAQAEPDASAEGPPSAD